MMACMTLDRAGVCCAHCRGRGAEHACPRCGALVCATCHAEPKGCAGEQPTTMLRLDLGARLVEADAEGRLGLAPYEESQLRAVDLHSGMMTFLSARVSPGDAMPRLLSSGKLAVATGAAVRLLDLGARASVTRLPSDRDEAPVVDLCPGQDGRLLAVLRADSRLQIFDLAGPSLRASLQLPLARSGLLCVDSRAGLVAALLDDTLVCADLDGRPLGSRGAPAPVRWCGLGSGWLALIVEGPHLQLLQVDAASPPASWRSVTELGLPPLEATDPALHWHPRHRGAVAALGDHGRLAVALAGGDVAIYRLPHGAPRRVTTRAGGEAIHTTLLRFVGPHERLLAADAAGRVLCWPHPP